MECPEQSFASRRQTRVLQLVLDIIAKRHLSVGIFQAIATHDRIAILAEIPAKGVVLLGQQELLF